MHKLLVQKYHGDITIVPELTVCDALKVFTNPSNELVKKYSARGERATWSKLLYIENSYRIERILKKIVKDLKKSHQEL